MNLRKGLKEKDQEFLYIGAEPDFLNKNRKNRKLFSHRIKKIKQEILMKCLKIAKEKDIRLYRTMLLWSGKKYQAFDVYILLSSFDYADVVKIDKIVHQISRRNNIVLCPWIWQNHFLLPKSRRNQSFNSSIILNLSKPRKLIAREGLT